MASPPPSLHQSVPVRPPSSTVATIAREGTSALSLTTSHDLKLSNSDEDARSIGSNPGEKSHKGGRLKGLFLRIRHSSSATSLGGDNQSQPIVISSAQPVPSTTMPNEADASDEPFRQAVLRAQATVDRLESTQTVLQGIAGLAELGAGWLPGVGAGVQVIGGMLAKAREISVGKVAALRLVERSAQVLIAVQQSVIETRGHVSPLMQTNIERLLGNLNESAYLLTKLSQRSFLKLYLHAEETQRRIDKATEDLTDTISIFQVQSLISSAAWQEESRRDHRRDLELLLLKQEQVREDDQALLQLLGLKAEQQQEAIKTLQRTIDGLLAYRAGETTSPSMLQGPSSPFFAYPASHNGNIPSTPLNLSGHENTVSQPSFLPIDEHEVFCKRALDVLRRHSNTSDVGVPDWTITGLEIEHGERLSSGFFSVVWKGRWRGQDVAIQELSPTADRTLFIHEVDVWRQLKNPSILPFLGASSTTGPPPWFLISPFMKNGDILSYLRRQEVSYSTRLALIHQAAQGLEYLHSREIWHGDLKAANILITDNDDAVLCDFGLSHLKLDIVTKSRPGISLGGTLRWQSPERLAGHPLTSASDTYAFGMTIYEVFTGQVPFGYVDDYALRQSIQRGERPARTAAIENDLWELISRCWAQDSSARPNFGVICQRLSQMYHAPTRQNTTMTLGGSSTSSSSYITANEGQCSEEQQVLSPQTQLRLFSEPDEESSSSGSIRSIPTYLEKELSFESDRAERVYRHYLQHDFDDDLTIPLWFPSHITLGSLGYVRHGQFVKLLDAHRPPMEQLPPMPYLDEFSTLQTISTPINTESTVDKGLGLLTALKTTFVRTSGKSTKQSISRRVTIPLKPGMKQAVLIVDDGEFEIYRSFTGARRYLGANIDWVLQVFGESHHIVREDVIMVVGTLRAHNYTMLVSNFSPRTTWTFSVHANPERGAPWGTWTVNRPVTQPQASPIGEPQDSREEQAPMLKYVAKVSEVSGGPMDSVMLAKLRFPKGVAEPALYP